VLVFGFALSVYEWAHDQVIFLSWCIYSIHCSYEKKKNWMGSQSRQSHSSHDQMQKRVCSPIHGVYSRDWNLWWDETMRSVALAE
jgi:hypothetical protein